MFYAPLSVPKKSGFIIFKITPDAHSRISPATTAMMSFLPFSLVPSAPLPAIINPPARIQRNQMIYTSVIVSLMSHPMSFGKTLPIVGLSFWSLASFALGSFLIHLPMKGIFIFSVISVFASQGLSSLLTFTFWGGGSLFIAHTASGVWAFTRGKNTVLANMIAETMLYIKFLGFLIVSYKDEIIRFNNPPSTLGPYSFMIAEMSSPLCFWRSVIWRAAIWLWMISRSFSSLSCAGR